MEPIIPPTKEEQHRQTFGSLYDFFLLAEQNERLFTSKEIRDEAFPRSIKTVRKYISRHWSWFLHPVDAPKRQVTYRSQGIGKYPRDYFIQAHKPNQMQYFYHFARSIEAYEKRREEERQKRVEVQVLTEQLPLPETEPIEETTDQQQAPPRLDIQIAEETEPVEPVEQTESDDASETITEHEEAKTVRVEPAPDLHLQVSPGEHDHAHILPPVPPSGETPEPSQSEEAPPEDGIEKPNEEAGVKIHNIPASPLSRRTVIIILVIAFLVLLALLVAGYITIRKWFSFGVSHV
jgi:hypothetical protein